LHFTRLPEAYSHSLFEQQSIKRYEPTILIQATEIAEKQGRSKTA
jgi:hypothetical protein